MPAVKLAAAQDLTTTLTATTNTAIVNGYNIHDALVEWTPGTAGNVLTFTIEGRHLDAVTNGGWTQEMTWDGAVASGTQTNTRTLHQYQHTATGTTAVPLIYSFQMGVHEIRIKVAESEAGGATKGTITVVLFSRST